MNKYIVVLASAGAAVAASLYVSSSLGAAPPIANFVTGSVTTAGAGAPISGAVVEAVSVSGLNPSRQCVSDPAGFYVLDALGQDTYVLTCRASGYVSATQTASFTGSVTATANFGLSVGPVVQGAVTPISSGISIRFIPMNGGEDISLRTGTAGQFSCSSIPPGTYTLAANGFPAGMSTIVVTDVTVPPSGTYTVPTIDLSPATGSVAGTVSFDYTVGTGTPTGNSAEPAAGVKVKVFSAGVVIGHAITGTDGSFFIPRIPPHAVTVGNTAIHFTDGDPVAPLDPGIELIGAVSAPVNVTAGQIAQVPLVMRRGGSFQVRVRDANLAPIAAPSVVVTDSAGASVDVGQLEDLGEGVWWCSSPLIPAQYTIAIGAPGVSPASSTLTITAGQRTLVDVIL